MSMLSDAMNATERLYDNSVGVFNDCLTSPKKEEAVIADTSDNSAILRHLLEQTNPSSSIPIYSYESDEEEVKSQDLVLRIQERLKEDKAQDKKSRVLASLDRAARMNEPSSTTGNNAGINLELLCSHEQYGFDMCMFLLSPNSPLHNPDYPRDQDPNPAQEDGVVVQENDTTDNDESWFGIIDCGKVLCGGGANYNTTIAPDEKTAATAISDSSRDGSTTIDDSLGEFSYESSSKEGSELLQQQQRQQRATVPPNALATHLKGLIAKNNNNGSSSSGSNKPPSTTHSSSSSSRRSEAYGDSVYYQLFQEYTNYYIPVRPPQGHSNTGFVTSMMNRPTELFLRICLALWLEGRNDQLETRTKSLQYLRERKGILEPEFIFDLNYSYDLIKVKSYSAPPYQVQRCLHKLVARAVSDGALADAVRDTSAGLMNMNNMNMMPTATSTTTTLVCLGPVLHIMQLPFYNYIRTAFRHASIHARQSPFYTALNDWLMWLEPWNTKYASAKKDPKQRLLDSLPARSNTKTKTLLTPTVTYPKANQRSLYKPEWEAYIASNLHMYVVPLAIFLRRARELDFSPKFYRQSLNTVLKVFRVFSPEVVQVINKHLALRGRGRGRGPQQQPPQQQQPLSGMVAAHERNLGDYAPPENELSLLSCQNDMHNLLEEIYLQHLKKVDAQDFFDRMIARFDATMDSWFGSATATNEVKQLKMLVEKAKVIVGFPADYEVMPESRAASMEAQVLGMMDPSKDRTAFGILTDAGRERILMGNVKCNPEDVDYYGDRMLGRVQTHEVEFLVSLLVKASQLINAKLGLNPNPNPHSMLPRRFNLRFLADWRNVMTIIIVYRFLKLIV
mmetsp:Transcript_14836/g.35938  ORF Transcript_14836/g.35938 Transcript_14836/m.35938 type:complete len:847 (+) Transcript_14836:96-2636(+)